MSNEGTGPVSLVHPLEPLSSEELARSTAVLKKDSRVSESARITAAMLVEPSKDDLRAHGRGEAFERCLRLIGHDFENLGSFAALVSLSRDEVLDLEKQEQGQAPFSLTDLLGVIQIVKEDPGWQAALRKRGVEDFSKVQVDPWPAGGYPPAEIPSGHRMLRAICFVRESPEDNGYAHPVEGVLAYVDLDEGRVARLEDHGVVPIPPESGNYDPDSVGPMREDLREISITQPDGPSFEVDGYEIRWQKWSLRVSMHPINGLVLHQVGYEDQGRVRPILHRAALADMVVPYGDTSPMHNWKHVFDASELCLGHFVNSLTLGCDCLGEIHYFDASFLGWNGEPVTVENAICLHEEDFGILWKHTDLLTGRPEVRRSRRLVISSIHTIGNYDYGFFWYLYLDGTIQMEVKLTGIVGVSGIESDRVSETAPQIAPHIASPNHQHLFCARLDFALDGDNNSVHEVNAVPEPVGPGNPHGAVFRSIATPLLSEQDARRDVKPASSRHWKVSNPGVKNHLGQPVGYKLLPQGTPAMLAGAGSAMAERAGFAKHNLWVTAYDPAEMASASEFSNLHPGPMGVPVYSQKNRSIENTDVVVWHSFGLTHVPRPEDWPVMPVEYCGFSLVPTGFFDRNPALDVPPSKSCSSKRA